MTQTTATTNGKPPARPWSELSNEPPMPVAFAASDLNGPTVPIYREAITVTVIIGGEPCGGGWIGGGAVTDDCDALIDAMAKFVVYPPPPRPRKRRTRQPRPQHVHAFAPHGFEERRQAAPPSLWATSVRSYAAR
jgi:hypothetical protein